MPCETRAQQIQLVTEKQKKKQREMEDGLLYSSMLWILYFHDVEGHKSQTRFVLTKFGLSLNSRNFG